MNDVYLAIIAVATALIAIAQIGVMVAAGVLVRRLSQLTHRLEHDIKPLLGHLNAIGKDAARTATLAAAQVERADAVFRDLVVRLDRTLDTLQTAVNVPAREGRAIMSALRAAVQAIRDMRRDGRRRSRGEEEDALFI